MLAARVRDRAQPVEIQRQHREAHDAEPTDDQPPAAIPRTEEREGCQRGFQEHERGRWTPDGRDCEERRDPH